MPSAFEVFQKLRLNYDQHAKSAQAAGFWSQIWPEHSRLVQAYVIEAFARLGYDLKTLRSNEIVPQIESHCLTRHKQLIHRLYRVLVDGQLITATGNEFVRTTTPLESLPAQEIYQHLIGKFPKHDVVTELIRVVGSELAECLKGDKDVIRIVFGDNKNKKLLNDIYEWWPLFRTPTLVLGDFLTKAEDFVDPSGDGTIRILEVGAGTGGTTKLLLDQLTDYDVPFEYTFTDISAGLVGAAKKKFKGVDNIKFGVLDIEKSPDKQHQRAYDIVIASNCIHATRRLDISLKNLRQMVRDDGALMLVEITRDLSLLDLIFGLFEGWWLFEDDRSHVIVNEEHWQRVMREAGFEGVIWSDGHLPEATLVRLIGAFPLASATMGAG